MSNSSFLKNSMEREKSKGVSPTGGFFTREISGSVTQRFKRIRSKKFFKFTSAVYNLISHISTRTYGTALICFGLASTLMYFLKLSYDNSPATPIIGILISCLSIPFLVADKPLPIYMQDFKPTDYLFFEFFCMKRHSPSENGRSLPVFIPVIVGLTPAMLSSIAPLWQITLIMGVSICVYIGLQSPEFVFLTTLVCLPFIRFLPHSELVFALAILLAVVSFIRKVVYGRRVFFIEKYDIIIGVMLLFILISGIFIKGDESFFGSIKMIIFSLGYILAGNIITNRRLAELSVNSVILSGVLAALVSIGQFIVTISRVGRNFTVDDLSVILARADGVTVILLAALVFSFGMIKHTSTNSGGLMPVCSVLCFIALILSGEFFAISSIILGAGAYAVIKSNRAPMVILPVLLAVSVALLLLPAGMLNLIFTYSPSVVSADVLFDLWSKSASLLADHLAFGIGIGSESFASEMASMGIFGHPDSSNLFIELGLEAGILAPLCLLFLIITRVRHRSTMYLYVRNSQFERIANLSGACLFAMLAFGMVNYIWSDMSAYYLFWCVFGIGSASLRVAKRDYDDRILYYEESSAFDSSVIDIEIG
ncbi:MAG: hypothetical protein J6V80_04380 [Clostridia bacterium]|nr:hypothetical protein [Clostridia bacterium]